MLEQQTRTCSDKQKIKNKERQQNQGSDLLENLCFCVSVEVTVPKNKKQKNQHKILDGEEKVRGGCT